MATANVVIRTILEGQALDQLPARLRRIPSSVPVTVRLNDEVSGAANAATGSLGRLQREQQQLANLNIRVAQASRDYSTALNLVQAELNQTAAGTARYQQLILRQITLTNQAKRAAEGGLGPALPRTLDGLSGSAAAAASAFGLLGGVAGLGGLAISAGSAANSLERTEATVRALSGSTERYNEVLALAREGQARYGGSLETNLRGLGGLVNLSNRAGVSLGELDNIARRLAIVDPLQGFEGAQMALREFLSGSGAEAGRSLAERFEIPRQALAALGAEGVTQQQKLEGLNAALNQLGITNDVLANQTNTNAQAFTNLGAAFDNFKVAVGGVISDALAPLAQSTADFLNVLQGTPQAFVDAAAGAAYWQSILQGNVVGAQAAAEAMRAQAEAIYGTAEAQDRAAARAALYAGEQQTAAVAAGALGDSALKSADAIQTEAAQSLIAEANSRNLATAKQQLTDRVQAAAQAMLVSGQATDANVQSLAKVLGVAPAVIQSYLGIAAAARDAAVAQGFAGGKTATGSPDRFATRSVQQLEAQRRLQRDANAAQREAILATGTYAQRLAILTRERNQHTKGSAAYIRAQAEINRLQKSGARAGGGADTAKLQRQLLGDEERLIAARRQLASIKDKNSPEALRLRKEILDIEKRIGRARGTAVNAAGQDAAALQASRDALLSDEQKLAVLRQRRGVAKDETTRNQLTRQILDLEESIAARRKRANDDALRDAEALQRAQEDLMSNQELLARRRSEVAAGNLPEVERLKRLKDIRDLEKQIADEQERARAAAVDAQLSRLADAKADREAARARTQAQNVLASAGTTNEQKAAARDALQRLELENRKREMEIAELERNAVTGTRQGGPAQLPALQNGALPVVVEMPRTPAATAAVAPLVSPVTATPGADGIIAALEGLQVSVYVNGVLTPALLKVASTRTGLGGT